MEQIIPRQYAKKLGLKQYFTGKPCKYGHVAKRNLVGNKCVICAKIHYKKWGAQNKEKINEYRRKQRIKRYAKRKEEIRNWRLRNKEHIKAYSNKWKKKNASHIKEYASKYRSENPHIKVLSEHRRRARKHKTTGGYTKSDIDNLLAKQNSKCASCLKRLRKYHIDHILPFALGGDNSIQNIQILCPSCNVRKSKKHPLEWARQNGRLL